MDSTNINFRKTNEGEKSITVYNFVKNYFFFMRFFYPFSLLKLETNTENRIVKYPFSTKLHAIIISGESKLLLSITLSKKIFFDAFFPPFSLFIHETNTENRIEKYSFLANLGPVIVLIVIVIITILT